MKRALPPARDLLTPELVVRAVSLVRDGIVHDLALTLDADLLPPVTGLPARAIECRDLMTPEGWIAEFGSGETGFRLDAISGSIHYGTHVDGLAHIVHMGHVFGGAPPTAHASETIPPIVGRGVLIDLIGEGPPLQGSHEVRAADLDRALTATGTTIEPGDIVLVRTGKMAELRTNREHFFDRQPGIGIEAAGWLAEHGMAAYGSDTGGTEPQPVSDWSRTVHVELLTRRGIHLFEWLDLDALAAHGRHDFLFVAASIKVAGASGGWVRPVALT